MQYTWQLTFPTAWEIKQATAEGSHLQQLSWCISRGWPESRNEVPQEIWSHWTFRDDMAVNDGIVLKGRQIVMPNALQKQVLNQLYVFICEWKNETTRMWIYILDRHKCWHWIPYKNCSRCLDFQQMQLKEKLIQHEFPERPWEVVGTEMFSLCNKNDFITVDYYSKFPVIKKMKVFQQTI